MDSKKRGMNKKGQLNLSFGMIFSIILIIIFLVFGFYAIKKFIDLQQSIQIEQFLSDFQEDVNTMWKSSQGSREVTYTLPTKINAVCFQKDDFNNLQFSSKNIIPGKKINNLDIDKITSDEEPYCIDNVKGKVSMIISKEFGEMLVTITR